MPSPSAWSDRSSADRARSLRRLGHLVYRDRRGLASLLSQEVGKSAAEALATEVLPTLGAIDWIARHTPRLTRPEIVRWSGLPFARKRAVITHEPYGVVGVITPWNYPLLLAAGPIVAALATGNRVRHKPSEFTPRIADRFAQLAWDAGVPRDALSLIHGDGRAGAALLTEPELDFVTFIGSVATGRRVAAACAARPIPCILELGGSDAAIVLADADLDLVAQGLAWGRLVCAGQSCVAPKRILVAAPAHDALVERLAHAVRRIARHTDSGPLINATQADVLRAQLADAIAVGARVVARAEWPPDEGSWFAPVLVTEVPLAARIWREEPFGPVMMVHAVRDEAEAIAIARDSTYGLSASVWTRDRGRGERVAAALHSGTVMVNDVVSVVGMPTVPHSGRGESGYGATHGAAGILAFTHPRTVVTDRLPGLRQLHWGASEAHLAAGTEAFTQLAHAPSWWERLRAVPAALRFIAGARR